MAEIKRLDNMDTIRLEIDPNSKQIQRQNPQGLKGFSLDKVPKTKIKKLHFKNFKVFDDIEFDFSNNNSTHPFICLHGPNGSGKTTLLEGLQLVFSRLDNYSQDRLAILLGKLVRHTNMNQLGIYGDDDFLLEATIDSEIGDYDIAISKRGFLKDHPSEIKEIVYRLCFYTKFDTELQKFQLHKKEWPKFKKLFESVTGFKVETTKSIFDTSVDPVQDDILQKYVLGFTVHKPNETISNKECSAGERKVIKSFSTLLNTEIPPEILLIDNVAMHVEVGRHIELIKAMRQCFPHSQLFATTHSYRLSRNFADRSQIYDLRLLNCPCIIREQPWRFHIMDELNDCISKISSASSINQELMDSITQEGVDLKTRCLNDKNESLFQEASTYLERCNSLFLGDIKLLKQEAKIIVKGA